MGYTNSTISKNYVTKRGPATSRRQAPTYAREWEPISMRSYAANLTRRGCSGSVSRGLRNPAQQLDTGGRRPR